MNDQADFLKINARKLVVFEHEPETT